MLEHQMTTIVKAPMNSERPSAHPPSAASLQCTMAFYSCIDWSACACNMVQRMHCQCRLHEGIGSVQWLLISKPISAITHNSSHRLQNCKTYRVGIYSSFHLKVSRHRISGVNFHGGFCQPAEMPDWHFISSFTADGYVCACETFHNSCVLCNVTHSILWSCKDPWLQLLHSSKES